MRHRKRPGQAIVELALSMTLIYLLFSATVDFGLAYFAYQGIAGAAQEGAQFGARKPLSGNASNLGEIQQRTRTEGGLAANRRGFVNLFDLNNNRIDDLSDGTVNGTGTSYITLQVVQNPDVEATGMNVPCSTSTPALGYCDVIVKVKYDYIPQFAFAAPFGLNKFTLTATRRSPITH
ncbi:MAG TPA: TadE family protein [Herpetosiphonaceae bacterium]